MTKTIDPVRPVEPAVPKDQNGRAGEEPPSITVSVDGGTVTLSTDLNGEDFLLLWQLYDLDVSSDDAVLRLYGPMLSMIERHTLRHTLDQKPILRRPLPVLQEVWRAWHDGMQGKALDPTSAGA